MTRALPLLLACTLAVSAQPPALKNGDPRTPAEERATFELAAGFDIDLVAAEPDVVDPVAMCFDEKGRIVVCEMRGYPNGGVGTGNETRGRIRVLEDRDGDGRFETATTFAEGLRFPMGVTPWDGGIVAAVAPDLLYLKDTDGDGKADVKRVLYTGFNLANIQQMVNGLQWGLDNWVYGVCGSDGGVVKSAEKADAPEVNLRNRGFRFRPWQPGSLEPTSGGGQYGLTADEYGHWFTATNSQHLRQIVLPDQYLRRNPYLAVTAVTIDIPEHGAAAKVFRASSFEAWRVERTTRRAGSPDAKRFPTTELVPGGYITSACSPLIYTADLFPAPYRGNNFVCDPANNLIHRETLHGKGAVFTARRADENTEFLRSTDNWFRPVHLTLGPDGAVYVLDFYREVIETPLSLPDDIKARMNLESRGRGRIWRVAPAGNKAAKLKDVSGLTSERLVDELFSTNPTRRITAQRLLVERQPADAAVALRERVPASFEKAGYVNLLWTLHGLGKLRAGDVLPALGNPRPAVRVQALRLSEGFYAAVSDVRFLAGKQASDPDPQVRFQAALSAGEQPPADAAAILAGVLRDNPGDPWIQTAALSSAANCAEPLVGHLWEANDAGPSLSRVAGMVGAKGDAAAIVRLLGRVADGRKAAADAAVLDGLGQGMRNSPRPLATWWATPPAGAEPVMARLRDRFRTAGQLAQDEAAAAPDRASAAVLLAYGPFELAEHALPPVLAPTAPGDLQLAAVRTLAAHTNAKVPDLLLAPWAGYSPAARREVVEALLARPDRTLKLLDAIGKNQVSANELDPARVKALKAHPAAAVRAKAEAVLKATVNADRAKVVAGYAAALDLKGDAGKGRGVFKTHCAACHRLDGVGADVGANLLAALPNKSGDDLLAAVFDPNREVDPRFVNYQAVTADGRTLGGVIAAETPTSVTLRRADGAEDTVLRANLESLRSTRLSLMPEGLERVLTRQDVADLFAYLRVAGK
ncbi:PVC-type heme-binding CxxCH protein [Urbifossiella limnaea]|uniref:Cytochrome c n=1 Tax=Urbifossiella limnaea TaxID=2528023 RepID=A0A517XUE9_9BACT|nr:PVC-type heme-binding CxxCH protein [Urbifossiella limnaea]QDU21122.1 Cytochrome c [Urbifossiella limnaea]